MRLKKNVTFLSLLIYVYNQHSLSTPAQQLLIIETGNNSNLVYLPTTRMFNYLGFKTIFKHAYEVEPADCCIYKNFLILLDPTFFQATLRDLQQFKKLDNPYLHHIYDIFESLKKQKDTFIIFALPSLEDSKSSVLIFDELLGKLFYQSTNHHQAGIFAKTLEHFFKSDKIKSINYETTLLTTTVAEHPQPFEPLLPLCKSFYQKITNKTIVICNSSSLLIGSLCDPFCLTPLQRELSAHLKELIYKAFQEITNPYLQTHNLPQQKYSFGIPTLYQKYPKPLICAWSGIESFKEKEPDAIQALFQSGVTHLWIDLNPEWFLADRARMPEKKDIFLSSMDHFMKAYKQRATANNSLSLLIGTDLTSNFAIHKPLHAAIDMYGFVYDHIPSPLDTHNFWNPEFFTVFDRFIDKWKTVDNDMQLAGFFFDFEMYHAQHQAAQYLSLMDFSDIAWNLFVKKTQNEALYNLTSTNQRVEYLLKNKLCSKYFLTLEKEATQIGKLIKKHISKKMPNPTIGAYNIYLPYNWFYQGIYRGLSSCQNPLISATFCTEFAQHDTLLKERGIHLVHLPAILLSKITESTNTSKLISYCTCHQGFWINRFSRLFESRNKKDWEYDWSLEVSPLSTEECIKKLKTLSVELQHISTVHSP